MTTIDAQTSPGHHHLHGIQPTTTPPLRKKPQPKATSHGHARRVFALGSRGQSAGAELFAVARRPGPGSRIAPVEKRQKVAPTPIRADVCARNKGMDLTTFADALDAHALAAADLDALLADMWLIAVDSVDAEILAGLPTDIEELAS